MTDLVVLAEDAAPLKKVTSADIKLGIKNSFAGGYQTFFEVGNDTGANVRRHADAVSIGIWPSTGHQIHGFEVKVSRTDFLNEMKDPAKSQAIFRYCHRWSLATPPGLVSSDELPPNWGLVTFDGKSLRTVKKAPLLTPEALSPGFVAALVRRAGEADAEVLGAARAQERKAVEAKFEGRLEQLAKDRRDSRYEEGIAALRTVEVFKAALGENWVSEHNVAEIAAVIKAIRKMRLTGNEWDSIQQICDTMQRAEKDIRHALEQAGFNPNARKRA